MFMQDAIKRIFYHIVLCFLVAQPISVDAKIPKELRHWLVRLKNRYDKFMEGQPVEPETKQSRAITRHSARQTISARFLAKNIFFIITTIAVIAYSRRKPAENVLRDIKDDKAGNPNLSDKTVISDVPDVPVHPVRPIDGAQKRQSADDQGDVIVLPAPIKSDELPAALALIVSSPVVQQSLVSVQRPEIPVSSPARENNRAEKSESNKQSVRTKPEQPSSKPAEKLKESLKAVKGGWGRFTRAVGQQTAKVGSAIKKKLSDLDH
jgi:hypothetical protein